MRGSPQPKSKARPGRSYPILAAFFAALLLVSALPFPAAAATATLPPLGMSMGHADELMEAGATPRYGTFWVGPWTAESGWDSLDGALQKGRAMGVTPVIHWYYWGDSISPSCVENGCDGRSKAQWFSMTDTLAERVRAQMGGREVVIVLENEFNKAGMVGSYSPTFDGYLETVAHKLDAVDGVKLVVGFGGWVEWEWHRFPKAIAASDYVGFQMMRGSTRDSEASYRGAAPKIVHLTDYVSTNFNKPSFLYDLALSSYPDSHWEKVQAETLSQIFDELSSTSGSTGLQAVLYRSLVDNPHMGEHNYFGLAERHWGLQKAYNGGDKPAWAIWKAKATGSSTGSSTPFDATFTNVKVDEWWTHTSVYATATVANVEARIDGGAWFDLPKTDWGAYGKSFRVLSAQCVQFRAHSWGGETDYSGKYGRGGGACTSDTPFDATFTNVKVDEWWTHTSVGGNKPVAKVEARVEGGAWFDLPKTNWGAYGKSFRVLASQCVEFRATSTDGTSDVSGKFGRGGGACVADVAFSATFSGIKVDEWWTHTSVGGNKPLAKVEARVDGGAWMDLPKTSWGAYGKSFRVLSHECVEFRATATDGSTAYSGKHGRGGGACAPAAAPFDASYNGVKTNEWWVQVSVDANQPFSNVHARVDGGTWIELPKQSWGAYAKSIHVKSGQHVQFRVTASDGTMDYSGKYWR